MTLPDPSRADSTTNKTPNRDLEYLLGARFEEKPVWSGLYENVRDLLFPAKLPPLELTSAPVVLPDRMASRTNPWAVGVSTVANGGILAIAILLAMRLAAGSHGSPHPLGGAKLSDLSLLTARAVQLVRGGGSGGANELTDPKIGRPPRFETMPIVPPTEHPLQNPILPVEAAVAVPPEVKLPDDFSLPNVGVHQSVIVVPSDGPGAGAGIGSGNRDGVGPGNGPGFGPGDDGGTGGFHYVPGVGGVTAPIPLVTPEAEFSDEARRVKHQGICTVAVIVDANGNPRNAHILRSLGMGLDEKALEAVRLYRFKPAKKDGKAVAVEIVVEVNFRLY